MAQALIVIDIQEGLVKENPFDTKNFIINRQAIVATADGRVVYAGNALRGYGNLIIIKHKEGL